MAIYNLKKTEDQSFWAKISLELNKIIKIAQTAPYGQEEPYQQRYIPEEEGFRTQEDIDEEEEARVQPASTQQENNAMLVKIFSKFFSPAQAIQVAQMAVNIIRFDSINKQGGRFANSIMNSTKAMAAGQKTPDDFLKDLKQLEILQKRDASGEKQEITHSEEITKPTEGQEEENFEEKLEKYKAKGLPIVFFPHGKERMSKRPPHYKVLETFGNTPKNLIQGEGLLADKSKKFFDQMAKFLKSKIGSNADMDNIFSSLAEAMNIGKAFSENYAVSSFLKGANPTTVLEDMGNNKIRFIINSPEIFSQYAEFLKNRTGVDLNSVLQEKNISITKGSNNLDVYDFVSGILRQTPNNGLDEFIAGQIKNNFNEVAKWIIKVAREVYYKEPMFAKELEIGEEGGRKQEVDGTRTSDIRSEEMAENEEIQALQSFKAQMTKIFEDIEKITQAASENMRENGKFSEAAALENLIDTYSSRIGQLFEVGKLKMLEDALDLRFKRTKAGINASLDPTKIDTAKLRKLITRHTPRVLRGEITPEKEMQVATKENFFKRLDELRDLTKKAKQLLVQTGSIEQTAQELGIRPEKVEFLLTSFDTFNDRYNMLRLPVEEQDAYDGRLMEMRGIVEKIIKDPNFGPNEVVFDRYKDIISNAKRFLGERRRLLYDILVYVKQVQRIDEKEMFEFALKERIKRDLVGFVSQKDIAGMVKLLKKKKGDLAQTWQKIKEENKPEDMDKKALLFSGASKDTRDNPLKLHRPKTLREEIRGIPLRDQVYNWCEAITNMVKSEQVSPEAAKMFVEMMHPKGLDKDTPSRQCVKNLLGIKSANIIAFNIMKEALNSACMLKSLKSKLTKQASSNLTIKGIMSIALEKIKNILSI